MRILVIFTGGTIGSKVSEGIISPDNSTNYELIKKFRESAPFEVDFDTLEPYSILSECLSGEKINLLIKTVKENLNKNYDGIIVTHGTDTLQYSAAALSFALGNNTKPVVLVGSQLPLEDGAANGSANFDGAVRLILEENIKGVFVAYRNEWNGPVFFYEGHKVLSHSETTHELNGLEGKCFGRLVDNRFDRSREGRLRAPLEPKDFVLKEKSGVLVVRPYPGQIYEFGDLSGYENVLIYPYHSGTLDTENESFKAFCAKVKGLGKSLFLAGVKTDVNGIYESAKAYEELGIEIMDYMTFPAAYMTLWIKNSLGGL